MTARSVKKARNLASSFWRNTIRPHMPKVNGKYNGVDVPAYRLGDYRFTSERPVRPNYEKHLIEAVKSTVTEGDNVVVIGGGAGVSSYYAAKSSKTGKLIIFEASEDKAELVKKTLSDNGITEFDVVHGLFYEAKSVRGELGSSSVLTAKDIPSCDVLVMDCEGAEKKIVEDLDNWPEKIIVETHGCFDSPTNYVVQRLEARNYCVELVGVENQEKDVKVFKAVSS